MSLSDAAKTNKLADNLINDNINAFNQMLSSSYAMFSNALDEVENITPEEERYLLKEKVSQMIISINPLSRHTALICLVT